MKKWFLVGHVWLSSVDDWEVSTSETHNLSSMNSHISRTQRSCGLGGKRFSAWVAAIYLLPGRSLKILFFFFNFSRLNNFKDWMKIWFEFSLFTFQRIPFGKVFSTFHSTKQEKTHSIRLLTATFWPALRIPQKVSLISSAARACACVERVKRLCLQSKNFCQHVSQRSLFTQGSSFCLSFFHFLRT